MSWQVGRPDRQAGWAHDRGGGRVVRVGWLWNDHTPAVGGGAGR